MKYITHNIIHTLKKTDTYNQSSFQNLSLIIVNKTAIIVINIYYFILLSLI